MNKITLTEVSKESYDQFESLVKDVMTNTDTPEYMVTMNFEPERCKVYGTVNIQVLARLGDPWYTNKILKMATEMLIFG